MKDFYKKHNFDINQTVRQNRKFHIVRYFPKVQTYEFINVGIILYEKSNLFYRLLHPDEVSKLHCPSLIESKVLKNSLESLDKYLQNEKSVNDTLLDISKRYTNILDTSFQLVYGGTEKTDVLLKKLFHDYIGYKFDVENKKDRLIELIQVTKKLVTKDYKGLEVKSSKIKGYSLDFFNKRTHQIHHSLLGSIENSENVARAFLKAPSSRNNKQVYDFLNTRVNLNNHGIENKIKLQKIDIDVYKYANEEDIARYCEAVLQ